MGGGGGGGGGEEAGGGERDHHLCALEHTLHFTNRHLTNSGKSGSDVAVKNHTRQAVLD